MAGAAPAAADTGHLANWLAARVAEADGRGDAALAGYARALDAAPGNRIVALRTYREAIAAGDAPLVRRAIAALGKDAPFDAALFPLVDAARAGDIAAFDKALAGLNAGVLRMMVPALRGWLARVRGGDGVAAIDAAPRDPIARRFVAENRALLQIAGGQVDAGIAALGALTGPTGRSPAVMFAGELLIADHPDQAAALLDDKTLISQAKIDAARPTLAFATSRLLVRIARELDDAPRSPIGLALARAALDADPGYVPARLALAGQLARDGDRSRALAALTPIDLDGPFAEDALTARFPLLDSDDRAAEGLALARDRARSSTAQTIDQARYADLLTAADRPGEALPWYRKVLKDKRYRENATAWLRYGAALDGAGKWTEARKALQRALALDPDQPQILNYLGYGEVEHGGDLTAAIRLLERAHALARDDGSIADSLGWAYHRNGDPGRAIPLLERAAFDEPASSEIAEHLGDAYWSVGRRYEARYAWAAAAVTAEAADAKRLATKQANGL